MTINQIIAGANRALANKSVFFHIDEEILGRLEDGEIFDDYEKDEVLPDMVAAQIVSLLEHE